MSHPLLFDTHGYVKRMMAAGFSEKQAEAQAASMAELIDDRLASKQDLTDLEERLTDRLTIRLGGMMVVAVGTVATLVKLL